MFSKFTLLDGGFSTALEQLGNTLDTSIWSGELLRSQQDQIRAAHQLFVDAGAEILISSAYQVTYSGCIANGWSRNEVDAALEASTELARFGGVKVAASVGPYGAYLADGSEYRGNYGLSKEALKEFHRARLQVLIATNPDLLAIETIPELTEAEAIIELIAEMSHDIPYWISFSCKSGTELSSGENFSEAVQLVNKARSAVAVGINCTKPEYVASLLSSAVSNIPYVVYPNSGRQWDATLKQWHGSTSASFEAELLQRWRSLGANVIGGCCGVSPTDIAAIGKLLKS